MTNNTVILYSSTDGQTLKICQEIKSQIASKGLVADLLSIDDTTSNLKQYSLIIIGASIRYGVHHKKVIEFINSSKTILDSAKTVFFSVNLVARKPEKNTPSTNPYVIKFFKNIDWRPTLVEVFAGKLDYKKYPFFDRIMIQFIMWITKGPTNTDTEIEYTDWKKVQAFSEKIVALA
ncbi:MAG: menaquinone-dependent protoporphyrinogen IX dehydrogenase [Flavobacteriaceae bacterium]|nr:MAG: menaquinone-dependent protoporphyrinogen IX dehydrogenase [Flavobacteriaceae bacterium]